MMGSGKFGFLVAAAGLAALVAGHDAAAATSCAPKPRGYSTFIGNLQGWTSNTPAQIKHINTNGNPGGYLQFTDMTNDGTYIIAPAGYYGSWSTLDNAGYLTFQHKIFTETNPIGYGNYEIRLSGPGGAAKYDGAAVDATTTGWRTVVAPLVQADWTVTSGTWAGLLSNVTNMQINIELVTNQTIPGDTDIEGIDNVALIAMPCGFYTPAN